MESITKVIEQRYLKYLDEVKKWDEDIPTGSSGECDLCSKHDSLTEHHVIPKRLIKGANVKLGSFLMKLTINICVDCHNKLHPENIWKKDLIELEKTFDSEAKKLDAETRQRIEANDKAKSLAQQELNNINTKLNNIQAVSKGKDEHIANLKKEIADLKSKLREKDSVIEEKIIEFRKMEKEINVFEDHAVMFYNTLLLYKDEEDFKKELHKAIVEHMTTRRDELFNNKRQPQFRDVDMVFKKIEMTPMMLQTYTPEIINDLHKNLEKVWKTELKKGIEEVFEIPVELKEKKKKVEENDEGKRQ